MGLRIIISQEVRIYMLVFNNIGFPPNISIFHFEEADEWERGEPTVRVYVNTLHSSLSLIHNLTDDDEDNYR
jgi:hypothetical protein